MGIPQIKTDTWREQYQVLDSGDIQVVRTEEEKYILVMMKKQRRQDAHRNRGYRLYQPLQDMDRPRRNIKVL